MPLSSSPANDLCIDNRQKLNKVNCYKYLGLTLSSDLTLSFYIDQIYKKARKLVSMRYHNFDCASPSVKLKLYMALVRHHLEYACVAWDPHLLKDTCGLEKVQKFALSVCSGNWKTGYDSLLDQFNTTTLKGARLLSYVLSIGFFWIKCTSLLSCHLQG